jgi:hypothetical protein
VAAEPHLSSDRDGPPSDPDSRPAEDRRRVALAAAGLSFGAALLHVGAMAGHLREYWLFGVLFLIVAVLQLLWAEAVRRGRTQPTLLALGAVGNLAVAAVWVVSRTAGRPLGPEAGKPEAVGLPDVLATADELLLAAIVVGLLLRRNPRRLYGAARAPAWGLVAASALAALAGAAHV